MLELAYLAGLFDGEGMVRIQRVLRGKNVTYQLRSMIGMTHAGVISLLPNQFGGSVHVNDHSKRNPNARPQHCWFVSSRKALAFLSAIRPYLIVKADEVDLAVSLQANIDEYKFKLGNRYGKHHDHEQVFAFREDIYRRLMDMKRPHIVLLRQSKLRGTQSRERSNCPPIQ